jgi:hypothetical protein
LSLVSKGEFQELVSKILFHVECQPQHERYENVV